MKVYVGQFEFDTDEMSSFPTGVPGMPVIFVNENGAAFLQTIRRSWLAPRVRYIGRTEAMRLAAFYRIPGLSERLRRDGHTSAGAEMHAADTSPSEGGCATVKISGMAIA